MLKRRLVPLCGRGGIARVENPAPQRIRQGRTQRAREHGPEGPRGGLYGCDAVWHQWDRGKPAPRLNVRRLSRDFCGIAGRVAKKRPHRKAVAPRSRVYPLSWYYPKRGAPERTVDGRSCAAYARSQEEARPPVLGSTFSPSSLSLDAGGRACLS